MGAICSSAVVIQAGIDQLSEALVSIDGQENLSKALDLANDEELDATSAKARDEESNKAGQTLLGMLHAKAGLGTFARSGGISNPITDPDFGRARGLDQRPPVDDSSRVNPTWICANCRSKISMEYTRCDDCNLRKPSQREMPTDFYHKSD